MLHDSDPVGPNMTINIWIIETKIRHEHILLSVQHVCSDPDHLSVYTRGEAPFGQMSTKLL